MAPKPEKSSNANASVSLVDSRERLSDGAWWACPLGAAGASLSQAITIKHVGSTVCIEDHYDPNFK
jgi:hypothetical protein